MIGIGGLVVPWACGIKNGPWPAGTLTPAGQPELWHSHSGLLIRAGEDEERLNSRENNRPPSSQGEEQLMLEHPDMVNNTVLAKAK